MVLLKLATGVEIECDAVIQGRQYPVLHIYTNKITPVKAYQIFGDSEGTTEIKIYEDGYDYVVDEQGNQIRKLVTKERVFTGYTEIYSVQKASLYTENEGEILIWLQRPMTN